MVQIIPIDTPTLGDRSYLVHDGQVAFVVDPQRDIDRVLRLAAEAGVRITHVFETHIHNDYVTGGHALARATGADYHVNAADRVAFDRPRPQRRRCGQVGPRMRVRVLATPGHTHTHLSYVLEPRTATRSPCSPAARCSTARSADPTCSARHTPTPWCTASTPPPTGWPTSFPTTRRCTRRTGSAASARPPRATAPASTIGQRTAHQPRPDPGRTSPLWTTLLAGLDAWPAYYAHMAPANSAGPARAGPEPAAGRRRGRDPRQRHRRRESGWWTCATGSRSPPGTLPVASTSAWTAASPPTWAGSFPGVPR